jgi:hypothetical protein
MPPQQGEALLDFSDRMTDFGAHRFSPTDVGPRR